MTLTAEARFHALSRCSSHVQPGGVPGRQPVHGIGMPTRRKIVVNGTSTTHRQDLAKKIVSLIKAQAPGSGRRQGRAIASPAATSTGGARAYAQRIARMPLRSPPFPRLRFSEPLAIRHRNRASAATTPLRVVRPGAASVRPSAPIRYQAETSWRRAGIGRPFVAEGRCF